MNFHTLHFNNLTSSSPAAGITFRHRSRRTGSPALWKRHPHHRPARARRWEQGSRSSTRPLPYLRSGNPEPRWPSSKIPVWKRSFDVGLILIILPVILILGLLAYCWIKVVSPGPALFLQTRIGRGGKPFTIYKFRSMKLLAETRRHEAYIEHLIKSNQPMTKLDVSGDPRVIIGGRLIRMSGLDELPQLLNVLRGEMSLVGPRPCTPNEFVLYERYQLRRFSLQPGLTGLWQIKRNHTTTFREMVAMDDQYVERLSLGLDFKIIMETPQVLLRQLASIRPVRSRVFDDGMRATHRPG